MSGSRAASQYNESTWNLALHAFGTNPQDRFGWLATKLQWRATSSRSVPAPVYSGAAFPGGRQR